MAETPIPDQEKKASPSNPIRKISDYLVNNSPGMRVFKTALAVLICLIIANFTDRIAGGGLFFLIGNRSLCH